MHFERRFTTSGQDAYTNIEFRSATSEIRNPDGTIVFQAENIEVPAQFSQVDGTTSEPRRPIPINQSIYLFNTK